MIEFSLEKNEKVFSLLERRLDGRLTSKTFAHRFLISQSQSMALLDSPRIVCPDRFVTSLDIHPVDTRFLLSGSHDGIVSIYDLSNWGSEKGVANIHQSFVHKPIARSTRRATCLPGDVPNGHLQSIISARWYPFDSGLFVSAASSPEVLVWDTNAMSPVSCIEPFLFEGSTETEQPITSCLELSPWNGTFAAAGSRTVPRVKLIDIRLGTSTQTLTTSDGTSALHWSPVHEYILACGSRDGCVSLWDIRKAGSQGCIRILDHDFAVDGGVSMPYDPSLRHLRLSLPFNKSRKRVSPNDYRMQRISIKSHQQGVITGLAWAPSGHYLVSASSEGEMYLWDLHNQGELIPRRFTSPGMGRPLQRISTQLSRTPLSVDENEIIWTKNDTSLFGFDMHNGGSPQFHLKGHLKGITCLARVPNAGAVITGGRDGLILVWGRAKKSSTLRDRKRTRDIDSDTW